jgi:hypothetical protein
MPSLAGVNVTTTAPRLDPAIPAPPESGTPATAAALVLPVQPDGQVGTTVPDGVAGWLDEDFGIEHARTTDRKSALNSPLAARTDCGQADRSGDTASPCALAYALRRVCQGAIDCIGRSPVPGEQLLKLMALGAAGDQTFEHVGQIGEWITPCLVDDFCSPSRSIVIKVHRSANEQDDNPRITSPAGPKRLTVTKATAIRTARTPHAAAFATVPAEKRIPHYNDRDAMAPPKAGCGPHQAGAG